MENENKGFECGKGEKIGIKQNKYRKRKRDEMRKKEKKCYNRGMISTTAYQRERSV